MTWDGKEERRKMSDDWIKRDRILSEVHADVKHLIVKLEDHVKQDDKIQGEIKRDLMFHQKIVYGLVGVFLFIEFVLKFAN